MKALSSESMPAAEASESELAYGLAPREVQFLLDESDHDRDAVYAACYRFVDRCWVFLSREDDAKLRVRLRAKSPDVDEEALVGIAEGFAGDLIEEGVRLRIARATRPLRERYTSQALFGGHQNATVAQLLAELDEEELGEEPLDVSVPWEKQDD